MHVGLTLGIVMSKEEIIRVESVSQFMQGMGEEPPKHPLIAVIDLADFDDSKFEKFQNVKITSNLYSVYMKDGDCGMMYGRNKYDFEEGVLRFVAPDQVIMATSNTPSTYGFMLVFHPDLIRNFDLGKNIGRYSFFDYNVHEALHLSKKEENILLEVANNIKQELEENIDKHSQEVLVTNLQLLLNYSKRYYERQFITRSNDNSDVVTQVERLIHEYYEKEFQLQYGTPSPDYFADKVNYSAHYLSDLLKKETGKSTKDHVDSYVVELAKTQLINSSDSVSEIAYGLGFNYPHYFSRMFKKRTGETPQEYRSKTLS